MPATSDADGRIECVARLDDDRSAYLMLRDERWLLAPTEQGGKPTTGRRFVAAETPIEFPLVPACVVEGRILRPNGMPAPFAQVDLECDGDRGWQRVCRARTDRSGAFVHGALKASADDLRLVVTSEHGCLAETGLRLAVQGDRARVGGLTLGPPGTLTGVIRTRTGEPAIGSVIQLVVNVADGRGQGIAGTLADSKGRFRFAGLAAGDYRLTVPCHGPIVVRGPRPTYRVESGETLEVELEHPQR